ncbi:transcriptional repressor LexA [Clostridium beijerinckii]|jgi:SOS regulatory protein LexA|uniref:Repressor LexA n=2 Tax=Clostridium beijerinckii TaxID=1520 RepID=A0AAE2UX73_CLOBE|nr:transcriptional repressor LexA [Clostridium beijerinckii]ABR34731.1 putative prophage repressor [Clostridium beijerinckii NCIMB 8052]AIU04377.1 putative prophage repressor [Clostridium beijerinckii ATCC 35702]ALB46176.1 repressor LexA [Clostridium beijerinckii NRRL B-598]MBF7810639.1 repressor LexA [Clostridium beijerinckii]NOW91360.1 SOS regulatory protein LexA [Clostridium beijerinckii]
MEFGKKQKKIINNKPNGHLLIKGPKGSGKTTSFIHKIPSLLNNYCISKDDKILVAACNEGYSDYFYSVYRNIEGEKYHQNSFFDEDNSDKLEIRTIDSLVSYYLNKYVKNNNINLTLASFEEREAELKDAIHIVSKRYEKKKPDILNLDHIEFIQDEIKWIKSCNYLKLEEYQSANRVGRINNLNIEISKILRRNSKQRQAIFEVLEEYTNNLGMLNKIDVQDMELLALNEAKKAPIINYTHIFIDNSQQLTKVQLELFKSLYNEKSYSSITFIMDTFETAIPNAWLVKGRHFSSLGYDMKGKCISLNECYKEIEVEEIEGFVDSSDKLIQKNETNKNLLQSSSLTLGSIEYIDLKRNISHRFIKDSGSVDEIYVDYNNFEEKVDDVVNIPVFNEIAAGNPILINEYIEDSYSLPKDWIRTSKDVFMLKVKGDSMINKNIYDGDYVVISKQNMPRIKDIVAVDIEGEATLKTYKVIDGKIALIPENDKYQPIIIEDQQFNVLGVAIGLIKNS